MLVRYEFIKTLNNNNILLSVIFQTKSIGYKEHVYGSNVYTLRLYDELLL